MFFCGHGWEKVTVFRVHICQLRGRHGRAHKHAGHHVAEGLHVHRKSWAPYGCGECLECRGWHRIHGATGALHLHQQHRRPPPPGAAPSRLPNFATVRLAVFYNRLWVNAAINPGDKNHPSVFSLVDSVARVVWGGKGCRQSGAARAWGPL